MQLTTADTLMESVRLSGKKLLMDGCIGEQAPRDVYKARTNQSTKLLIRGSLNNLSFSVNNKNNKNMIKGILLITFINK